MNLGMNQQNFDRLTQQLMDEIESHPHKDEIVALATEQLLDDTDFVTSSLF